ncbi:hypothetical protein EJ08DRAFT_169475 [Tothia fuscella]|uniref:Uncharacterized protein n=1 Tax=Tothia fuscella TaxID=1048955 RepID=A0A9P4NV24_9PEZI|nr:hypothetical protein EJ08DRAFT_169475 [Tothia fuscella]
MDKYDVLGPAIIIAIACCERAQPAINQIYRAEPYGIINPFFVLFLRLPGTRRFAHDFKRLTVDFMVLQIGLHLDPHSPHVIPKSAR